MARRRLAIIGLGRAVTPHARSLLDLQDRVEALKVHRLIDALLAASAGNRPVKIA
jgi:hypothetical protein